MGAPYIYDISHLRVNAGLVKLFAEASELFLHYVFQLVVCKTSFSKCIFQETKKMELAVC